MGKYVRAGGGALSHENADPLATQQLPFFQTEVRGKALCAFGLLSAPRRGAKVGSRASGKAEQ